jgi:hypothetical protein
MLASTFALASCDLLSENSGSTTPKTSDTETQTPSKTDEPTPSTSGGNNDSNDSNDNNSNNIVSHEETAKFNDYNQIDMTLYMKQGQEAYNFEGYSKPSSDSYLNINSIGELRINANYDTGSDNNKIYLKDNSATLYYKMIIPSEIKDTDGYVYEIYDDSTEKILDYTIGHVKSGALLILKSYDDGTTWNYDNTSFVNIGNNVIKYSPSGEDISTGTDYRIISALKVCTKKITGQEKHWIFWPFKYDMVDVEETIVYSYMQEVKIHIESGIISAGFYSNEVDYKYESEDAITSAVINKSSTLTDGSVTFDKITYSNNGNKRLKATCSFNDGEAFNVADGDVFTEKGKYCFTLMNGVGTSKTYTMFILDKNTIFEKYFGTNIFDQTHRIYDATSNVPVYMVGSVMSMKIDNNMPNLYGSIYKITNNQSKLYFDLGNIDDNLNYTFEHSGAYCVDLYVGSAESSGQKVNYKFYFNIVNMPDYKPSVNYQLLKSADRFLNTQRKVYAVNYETTKGGAYVFIFPATENGYELASEFSLNIEKRFIETYTDSDGVKYYYYHGRRYDSKVELFEAINNNLMDDVYLTYINPDETYGISILSDDQLSSVENNILEKDVRVCLSQEIKNALVTKDVIINDFTFTQIAPYECSSVTAIDPDGVEISIPFETSINDLFTKSGIYTIREENWNGINEYNVSFIKNNENLSKLNIKLVSEDDSETHMTLDSSSNGNSYNAKRLVLEKTNDVTDSQSLIIISAQGFRQVCLLSECDTYIYSLSLENTYKIQVINRLGYSYSITVSISGNYVEE